jgi:hypothetical protein
VSASDEPTSAAAAETRLNDEPFQMPDIIPATIDPPIPEAAPSPAMPSLPASAVHGTPPITRPVMPSVSTPTAAARSTFAAAAPVAATRPATSWADHMTTAGAPTPAASGLRSAGGRPRVRKVTRVLRHIDPWSTFKVALVFSAVTYVVVLTSGVLLWRVADSTGTLANVERWFTQFGWETFELKGGEVFHNAWIIGLFGAVALTGVAVLMATLFNLVSDIVGGVRVTVLEEEVVERTITSTRRYVVRRPPMADDTGGVPAPAWSLDDDDDGPVVEAPRAAASTDARSLADTMVVPAVDAADWSVDDDDPITSG